MMHTQIILTVLFQIFVFVRSVRTLQDKLFDRYPVQITRLDGRCHGEKVPVVTYYRGVKCDSRSAFVENSTIIIKEDLMNNLKCFVTVDRCQTRENLDSCEKFYKQENLDFCRLINPDNVLVAESPLAVHYKPKLKCPSKKGIYQANNFTLNLTPLIFFDIDNWYWKIKFEIFSSDAMRLISCVHIEAHSVLRSRN